MKAERIGNRMGNNIVDDFLQEVEFYKYEPVSTGIDLLDKTIGGGLVRGSLVLLEGEPGAGKTALATQIFENIVEGSGENCLYFGLDMGVNQLIANGISRFMHFKKGVDVTALEILQGYHICGYDNTIEQEKEMKTIISEYEGDIISEGIIYNPEGVGASLDEILHYTEMEAIRREAAGEDTPLVVIDSLQSVTGEAGESEKEVIKRAVYSLKSYAVRHNSIVFVVAGRDAGQDTPVLEYSADLHLALAREDDLTPKVITLYVRKNRFWESNMRKGDGVKLYFLGGQSLFIPLDQWLKRRAANKKPTAARNKAASKEE